MFGGWTKNKEYPPNEVCLFQKNYIHASRLKNSWSMLKVYKETYVYILDMWLQYIFDSNVSISGSAVHVLPKKQPGKPHAPKQLFASTSSYLIYLCFLKGKVSLIWHISAILQSPKRNTKKGSIKNHSQFRWSRILKLYIKIPTPHQNPRFLHVLDLLGVFSYAPFQFKKTLSFFLHFHDTSTHDTCSKTTKPKPRGFPVNLSIMTSVSTRFFNGSQGIYDDIPIYAQMGLECLPTWIVKSHGASGNYYKKCWWWFNSLKILKSPCDIQSTRRSSISHQQ